ncbi:M10 family metallopeptidase [Sagittula sp. NFXS13]|uniref:M10 family metallopeptidase n=1 Tax=Sagittula sp. NFXS13 TaxID=2819095 RepID=UPI0032DEDAC6
MCTICQARDPSITTYESHISDEMAASNGTETSVSATLPSYTLDQVARQLTHGYWNQTGRDWRAFDVESGGTLSYDVSQLDTKGQATALQAFEAWELATGISFSVSTSGSADIVFTDDYSGAYSYSYVAGHEITQSYVNVNTGWQTYGGYYLQTFIHEIGHAMGLGHAGNYNGSANFGTQAHYQQDSWQYSIMSYFGQWENPYTNASANYVATAQLADMTAMAWLYGASTTVNTGNTVYGDGTTLSQEGMDLSRSWAVTINDNGGIDTIDLNSRSSSQRIDLRSEHFSDVDGEVGNLAIMRGTVIENARTGSGNDHITGNEGNNFLETGSGDDTIVASTGDDTLSGGAGTDEVIMNGNFSDYRFGAEEGLSIEDGDDTTILLGIEAVIFADGAATIAESANETTLSYIADGETFVSQVVTSDTSNTQDWTSRTDAFDADGKHLTRVTVFDDGRIDKEDFTGSGDPSGPTTETLVDTTGTQKWETWTQTRDENGILQSSEIVMDDGVVRTTVYTDGVASTLTAVDTLNAHGWSSYVVAYDSTGALASNTMTLNSGVERVTTYTDGVRTRVTSTDVAEVLAWGTKTQTYDSSGALFESRLDLDNGICRETAFENGRKTSVTTTDGDDVMRWTSYTDRFDADGQRVSQNMVLDNGLGIEKAYANGTVVTTSVTDNEDLYRWDSYVDAFDENGQRVSRVLVNDNGLEIKSLYENGQRIQVISTDVSDIYRWETLTKSYDASGTLQAQHMRMDDGREITRTFSNGLETATTVTDTDDAFVWASYTHHFGDNGDRERHVLTRDDGLQIDTTFTENLRTAVTVTDGGDLYGWSSYTTNFNTATGHAVERVLTMDDGDEYIFSYMEPDVGLG